MNRLPRFEHVFSNIPNDRRHRAAIDTLRPFINHADYSMRVRGRGPKTPADRGRFGSIKLNGAKRLSIYFDSAARREESSAGWVKCRRAEDKVERLQHDVALLGGYLDAKDTQIADLHAALARIPKWLRWVCEKVRS